MVQTTLSGISGSLFKFVEVGGGAVGDEERAFGMSCGGEVGGSLALAMKPYGRLIFITSRKARALTSNSTIDADGSLARSFGVRLLKALKGATGLLYKKTTYKDKDSNLL